MEGVNNQDEKNKLGERKTLTGNALYDSSRVHSVVCPKVLPTLSTGGNAMRASTDSTELVSVLSEALSQSGIPLANKGGLLEQLSRTNLHTEGPNVLYKELLSVKKRILETATHAVLHKLRAEHETGPWPTVLSYLDESLIEPFVQQMFRHPSGTTYLHQKDSFFPPLVYDENYLHVTKRHRHILLEKTLLAGTLASDGYEKFVNALREELQHAIVLKYLSMGYYSKELQLNLRNITRGYITYTEYCQNFTGRLIQKIRANQVTTNKDSPSTVTKRLSRVESYALDLPKQKNRNERYTLGITRANTPSVIDSYLNLSITDETGSYTVLIYSNAIIILQGGTPLFDTYLKTTYTEYFNEIKRGVTALDMRVSGKIILNVVSKIVLR